MLRILTALTTGLAILAVATVATAQTTKPTQTTTTQATSPTSSSTQGAFDKLSLGNQKIAQALYDAQPSNTQRSGSTATTTKTYSLDQIAAMKEHRGWGVVFKDMQANGQIPSDVKNLGQLVSGKYQSQSGTSGGTTITSGSGRSQVVGNSGKPNAGRSVKGHFDDDASTGGQGAQYGDNSGRGSLSSGSGRGYGYGQGGSSGSSASSGGPGNSGQGGGHGK